MVDMVVHRQRAARDPVADLRLLRQPAAAAPSVASRPVRPPAATAMPPRIDEPPMPSDAVLERLTARCIPSASICRSTASAAARRARAIRERGCRRSIHVAGTNGKGSASPICAPCSRRRLARACLHLAASGALPRAHPPRRQADRRGRAARRCSRNASAANGGEPITFFEITTAAAFLAFARHAGRLPAARGRARRAARRDQRDRAAAGRRVHHADLASTTAVSRRHAGRDRREKAGIIKRGAPARGRRRSRGGAGGDRGARGRAGRAAVPLWPGMDGRAASTAAWSSPTGTALLDLPLPALPGAISSPTPAWRSPACRCLGGRSASTPARCAGFARCEWPARLQRLTRGPLAEPAARARALARRRP